MKFRKLKNWRIFSSLYGDCNKGESPETLVDSIGPVRQLIIEELYEDLFMFTVFSILLAVLLFAQSI